MIHGSYAPVRTTFWTDPDVRTTLTPDARYLLLYFVSSPHSNMIGLFSCPLDYAAKETGLSLADVRMHVHTSLRPFLTYDEKTEEVFVHAAARHRLGELLKDNDRRRTGAERLFRSCHSPLLRAEFAAKYAHWGFVAPAVPGGYNALVTPLSEAPSKPLPSPFEGTGYVAVAVNEHEHEHEVTTTSASPPVVVPPKPDPAEWMHATWEEILGRGRPVDLTPSRRQKYRALYDEQLHDSPDPALALRAVLLAVTKSDHHMSNRAYQMPESLFRSPDRRSTWVEKARAISAEDPSEKRRRTVLDLAEFLKRNSA